MSDHETSPRPGPVSMEEAEMVQDLLARHAAQGGFLIDGDDVYLLSGDGEQTLEEALRARTEFDQFLNDFETVLAFAEKCAFALTTGSIRIVG